MQQAYAPGVTTAINQTIDRFVEVPQLQTVQRQVPVPQVVTQEVIREQHRPVTTTMDVPVPNPITQVVDRPVPVPQVMTQQRQVPVSPRDDRGSREAGTGPSGAAD